jgi:tRNA1(Val) A37 N6-methylase TrmN6
VKETCKLWWINFAGRFPILVRMTGNGTEAFRPATERVHSTTVALMLDHSIESGVPGTQAFEQNWVQPGQKTFAGHAEHVARLSLPQPPASINGVELFLPPNVYHPGVGLSSRFLSEAISKKSLGHAILDLGCGSGFVGISLFRRGMALVLADISDTALASASENLRRVGIAAEVVKSDLFSGLQDRRFDSILFNPPLFDKAIEHEAELALCDPHGELLSRFLADTPRHLTQGGKIYFTASNLMNRGALMDGLKAYHFEILSFTACAQSDVSRWVVCASPQGK